MSYPPNSLSLADKVVVRLRRKISLKFIIPQINLVGQCHETSGRIRFSSSEATLLYFVCPYVRLRVIRNPRLLINMDPNFGKKFTVKPRVFSLTYFVRHSFYVVINFLYDEMYVFSCCSVRIMLWCYAACAHQ